jgi:hypothetical protein
MLQRMEKVLARVRELCSMDTKGGRFCYLGVHECMIYDIDEFTETNWSDLKAEFPRLLIDVMSDSTSLGGFVVRLRLGNSHHQRVLVTGALLSAMAAVVAHCLAT